ncbi:MAG: short-chain dehydrogenase, partial [Rhizorhabdus sp.]|nr:short-chain dehydrogenase [Rhizorhabdus sp.]
MDLGLGGRTALITGASQGVGREAARTLAAEGCNLILEARSHSYLQAVRDSILAEHPVAIAVLACDIGGTGAPEQICAAHPDIDILINNAGAIPAGMIDRVDDPTWRAAWDLKVFGYIGLTRCYFPRMTARGSGVILNVMGASGDRPGPNTIAIGMANSTLNAMTKAIGGTSAQHNVRVVGVNPGPIATERGIRIMRSQAEAKL